MAVSLTDTGSEEIVPAVNQAHMTQIVLTLDLSTSRVYKGHPCAGAHKEVHRHPLPAGHP